jgi:autotransporter-associated beta strand protein
MYKKLLFLLAFLLSGLFSFVTAQRKAEILNRGLVAVKVTSSQTFLSWRLLGNDPDNISFDIYRDGVKVNAQPIADRTNFSDNAAGTQYTVKTLLNGVETGETQTVTPLNTNYIDIVLNVPAAMTMPDNSTCTYSPNDCSTGDVDGDGEYEIIVKWDPSNAKDNSQSGYTGNVYIDVYKLNSTHLHRIDLGKNIRAGAHYTQFMVADFDGDGKAEIACKTAPGTKDGKGNFISKGPAATASHNSDYRNSGGYILTGPEYMTVFSGLTGEELATANYNPQRGTVSSWGDSYGNRVDRFLGGIAWLDGVLPSIIMCRGYYTRAVVAAWDYRNGTLTNRWTYDSGNSNVGLYGQGNHNMAVADVDDDGKDEIIWGSAALDHDGKLLYRTGLGHGDAMHLTDHIPDRKGLELWTVHESTAAAYGEELHDARTGEIIWGTHTGTDNGRGMAGNVIPNNRGSEMWSGSGPGLMSTNGTILSSSKPSMNFRIYWDGDLEDELLDGTTITKWGVGSIFSATGCSSNNGTKSTPNLSADLFGDWREELIFRTSDNKKLRIFTTTTPTQYRMYTLMHDAVYRNSIAWQNTAYNQPPHAGFYIGNDMDAVPVSDIYDNEKRWKTGTQWNKLASAWLDKNNAASTFADGDKVSFDISNGASVAISIDENVAPATLKVNSPFNVTWNGTGKITGSTGLRKAGAGVLTINNQNDFSGKTELSAGEIINNGALLNSNIITRPFTKISGKGVFGQDVELGHLSELSPGTAAGICSKLTFGASLVEKGSVTYLIDLKVSNGVVIAHDTISIDGDWSLSNRSFINLNVSGGTLPAGEYPLIICNAEITGDLNQIRINGAPAGFSFYLKKVSNVISLVIAAPASLIWSAATDTKWDNGKTANWLNGTMPTAFNASDTVSFFDGAASQYVVINEPVSPAAVKIDAAQNFSFSGTGSIIGNAEFVKNGTGKVTISNINTYTGKTIINGGVVEISKLSNGGEPSAIGAATAASGNFQLNGGKLVYTGNTVSTDRNITLGANGGTIAVNNSSVSLTAAGKIEGSGTLSKEGPGRLSIANTNTFSGGSIIRSGSVAFTSDLANSSGLGTDTITLAGGSLVMFNSPTTSNTCSWKLKVQPGSTSTLVVDENSIIAGSLSGAGTLYYNVPATTNFLSADLSAYAGTINVTTDADGGSFVLFNSKGYKEMKVNLNNQVKMIYRTTSNITLPVGDLTGAVNSILGAGGTAACTITWEVGARNANSTFNGKITNDQFSGTGAMAAIRKVGSGIWTLTNANTFSGGTTISEGVLMVNNTTGSGLGNGDVNIFAGGTLSGKGSITGSVTVNEGGVIAPGNNEAGTFTVNNNVTVHQGGILSIEIDKTTLKNDLLAVTGTLNMAGKLKVDWLNNSVPAAGDEFQIVSGNVTGAPSEIIPAIPGADLEWDLTEFAAGKLKIKTATGITKLESNSAIFPVPFRDKLNIRLDQQIEALEVSVFSLTGSELFRNTYHNESNIVIETEHLSKGIYMLYLKGNKESFSRKIVKE